MATHHHTDFALDDLLCAKGSQHVTVVLPARNEEATVAGVLTALRPLVRAGLVDDLDAGAHDGDTPAKGLKGHLTALAHGRVTTGALKIAVIGSGALIGGVLLARHRSAGTGARPPASSAVDAATSAVVIAAWANLLNLLDLRPGRALKTACIVSTPLLATPGRDGEPTRMLAAGTLGVGLAALPEDLLENTMLGDTGAMPDEGAGVCVGR